MGQPLQLGQPLAHAVEDLPQHLALSLGQPGFPPEAFHIAVSLPALQLPGIHDLIPLRQ
ncbi:hypothetical protein D3C84_1164830 [compost metagenome]